MKILFLDLEDTVIDDFTKGVFANSCNIVRVSRFIEEFKPDEIRLFSYALRDSGDLAEFKRTFQSWLEGLLDIKFSLEDAFTTEKLHQLCQKRGYFFESEQECMIFHGKDYGFQRYIEMSPHFQDVEVVLLDDVAENTHIVYPQRNVTLRTINVTTLKS